MKQKFYAAQFCPELFCRPAACWFYVAIHINLNYALNPINARNRPKRTHSRPKDATNEESEL